MRRALERDHGLRLTIGQFPFQTSGLADYCEGGVAEDLIRSKDHAYDLGHVLDWAKKVKPQVAPDSGKAHCSGTDYQLLGAVIEAVAGHSYWEALRDRICTPLGLCRKAHFDPGRDGDGQTLAVYHKTHRADIPRILSSMGPDGGIVSDRGELMTFLHAFMARHLFRRDNPPALCKWPHRYFPLQYGGGLMRFKLPGWMTLWRPSPELIGHAWASATRAYHAPETSS